MRTMHQDRIMLITGKTMNQITKMKSWEWTPIKRRQGREAVSQRGGILMTGARNLMNGRSGQGWFAGRSLGQ